MAIGDNLSFGGFKYLGFKDLKFYLSHLSIRSDNDEIK